MFHIVFDARGAQLITEAMDMDEALDGETILIGDDYSVGPLQDLFSGAGQAARKSWWLDIGREASEKEEEADNEKLHKVLQRMEEEEFDQIWIWVAPMSGIYADIIG